MSTFKLYSRENTSNQSDTIFTIIGRSEPSLTKSLAYLLHYSNDLLISLLEKIDKDIDRNFIDAFITSEQKPNDISDSTRRDIAISLRYMQKENNTLIIIEAKNLDRENICVKEMLDQITKYIDNKKFIDVKNHNKIYGVTLTKDKMLFDNKVYHFHKIVSLTWQEVLDLLSANEEDLIIRSFKQEIMSASFVKTYEEEIFSPPVGETFGRVHKDLIYCCPAERSHSKAIYFLPRIPLNDDCMKILRDEYNIKNFDNITGRGVFVVLYRISDSFIVDSNSTDSIKNIELQKKVNSWIDEDKRKSIERVITEVKKSDSITRKIDNSWIIYRASLERMKDEIKSKLIEINFSTIKSISNEKENGIGEILQQLKDIVIIKEKDIKKLDHEEQKSIKSLNTNIRYHLAALQDERLRLILKKNTDLIVPKNEINEIPHTILLDEYVKKSPDFIQQIYNIRSCLILDKDLIAKEKNLRNRILKEEEKVDQQTLDEKISKWIGNEVHRMKVFCLEKKMVFPKFKTTEKKNNSYFSYYSLWQIWGDQIRSSQ